MKEFNLDQQCEVENWKMKASIKREFLKKKEFDKVEFEKLNNSNTVNRNIDNLVKILGYIYKETYINA